MASKGTRDVELVIRAKNEASKALTSVSDALAVLTDKQKKAGKGSEETGTLLSQLGAQIEKLAKSSGAFTRMEKMADGMGKAADAVERLEQAVTTLAGDQNKLVTEIRKTEATLTGLKTRADEVGAAFDRQSKSLAEQKARVASLTTELKENEAALKKATSDRNRFGAAIDNNQQQLDKATAKHAQLTAEIEKAGKVTKRQTASLASAEKRISKYGDALASAKTNFEKSNTAIDSLSQNVAQLKTSQGAATTVAESLAKTLAKTEPELKGVGDQVKTTEKNLTGLRNSAKRNVDALEQQGGALTQARQEMNLLKTESAAAGAAMEKLGQGIRRGLLGTLRDSEGELKQYREEWRKATAEIQALAKQGVTMANPTPELKTQLALARQAKGAYQEMQQAIEVMRRSLRTAGQDTIQLVVAQSNFEKALANVKAKTNQLTQAQKQSAAAGQAAASAAAAAAERQASAYQRASAAAKRNADNTHTVANAMDLLAGRTRTAMSWTERLRGQLLALTSTYLGLYGAIDQLRAVTRVFMELEAATSRMNVAFGGNTAAVGREMRWVEDQADRLGIQVGILANEYSKLAVATRGTKLEGEETRKIFEAVAVAGRVSKLSLEQIQGTFLALSQMVSKGNVSMEELRRQLGDRLYGAFQIAARGMGYTTKKLDELVSTGQLATTDFLPKFRAELERTFGPQLAQAMETFTARLGVFQNEIFKARRTVAESGFIDGLSEAIEELTKQLKSDEGQAGLRSLGKAAGALAKILAEIPKYGQEIVFIFSLLIGSRIAAWVASSTGAVSRFRDAWRALPAEVGKTNKAMGAFSLHAMAMAQNARRNTSLLTQMSVAFATVGTRARTAAAGMTVARASALALNSALNLVRGTFALLGGLPGLIVTGLSFAFSAWLTSSGEVVDVTSEHEQQMARLLDAYSQAADKAGDWAKKVKGVSLAGAENVMGQLRQQLEDQLQPLAQAIAGSLGGTIGLQRGMFGGPGREIGRLTEQLMSGRITMRDFASGLNDLLKDDQLDKRIRQVIVSNGKWLDTLVALERNLGESALAVQEMGGNTGELSTLVERLGLTMAGLAEEAGYAGDSLNKNVATPMEKLQEQLDKLEEKIPGVVNELKLMETLKGIDEILNTAAAIEGLDKTSAAYQRLLDLADRARNEAIGQYVGSSGFTDRLVGVESGGDPKARNSRSTATGLGQFIESTWITLFQRYFPDRAESMTKGAILALREDSELSRKMIELYAQENAKILSEVGIAINDSALHLAHFLGPGGAMAVLTANATDKIEDVLSKEQIAANPEVLGGGKTVGDVLQWSQRKMGVTDAELALQQSMLKIEQDLAKEGERRKDKADQYHSRLAESLELKQQEAEVGKQRSLEEEVQLALAKEQVNARRAGTELTQQEIDRITEITRLNWERLDQQRQQKENEEQLNLLQQQRRDIIEQMELAKQTGDTEQFESLRLELQGLDQVLLTAIDNMIRFWEAVGGEKAKAAIAALNTARAQIAASGQEARLTAFDLGEMTGQMAKGGIDNFLSKIRETGDVLGSLHDAFLQFASDFLLKIAQMIAQQAVFNALQGFVGGGGFGGGFASAFQFHEGGVVGAGGVGRLASPSWFTNARRYHSGGIAGLRPNEVPAILERGEEVLTAGDPRHSTNGGGSNGGVQIINAIDTDQMAQAVLTSGTGKKAVLNLIKANKGEIKNILG